MAMDDLKEMIHHFSHPHSLILIQLMDERDEFRFRDLKCYCCAFIYSIFSSSDMYTCTKQVCQEREEFLCAACAELGESVEHHALHPRHPRLKLVDNREKVRYLHGKRREHHCFPPYHPQQLKHDRNRECGACCERISGDGFTYSCDDEECDFEMHVKCAHSLKPTVAHDNSHSHSHLLTLIPYIYHGDAMSRAPYRQHETPLRRELNCESCHCTISSYSLFARCVPCNLNYHIHCKHYYSDLPPNLYRNHYYSNYHTYCNPNYPDGLPDLIMCMQHHPEHPLTLNYEQYHSSCDVCCAKRVLPGIPKYVCRECRKFSSHLSCAFQSFPCPLSHTVTNVLDDLKIKDGPIHEASQCQMCKKRIFNKLPAYGCKYCNFYLHESCIRHWLQQPRVDEQISGNNELELVFGHGASFQCVCCERKCSGFVFKVKIEKWLIVDVECMLLLPSLTLIGPSLELIGHDHPVILLQRRYGTKDSYLRCLQCSKSFNIDVSCRFPRTLLHDCHCHPLTLVTRLTENDDDGEPYCDVCEDKRDKKECIYYCAECKFEAHIGCVKSMVLGPSGYKLKDVEFATLQEIRKDEEAKKPRVKLRDVFILGKELQECPDSPDDKEFDDILRMASRITWESVAGENLSYTNQLLNKNLYSDEPFRTFIEELNSSFSLDKTRSSLESLWYDDAVRLREYLVPLNFDEVVEALFDKYGDFGAACTCSGVARQYIFYGFCKALQSMCDTKIERVTESLITEWWTWFAMGKAVGFRIQFVLESLKRVVFAHFGLEADKYAIGELTTVRNEIKELPKEIEELREEWKELGRKLDGRRRKLEEAIAKEKDLREEVFRVRKSPLMNKCLEEAHDLAGYTVGETFLPPSD